MNLDMSRWKMRQRQSLLRELETSQLLMEAYSITERKQLLIIKDKNKVGRILMASKAASKSIRTLMAMSAKAACFKSKPKRPPHIGPNSPT